MPTESIVAKWVNPPKDGKKYGSIKTQEGFTYFATSSVLSNASKGPLTVDWEEQKWGQGDPVKVVTRIIPPPAQSNGGNGHAKIAEDRGGVPPHVSNVMGQAIQAGLIKDPYDLIRWAQYAYQAGLSMTQRPSDLAPEQSAPRQVSRAVRQPEYEEDSAGFP